MRVRQCWGDSEDHAGAGKGTVGSYGAILRTMIMALLSAAGRAMVGQLTRAEVGTVWK